MISASAAESKASLPLGQMLSISLQEVSEQWLANTPPTTDWRKIEGSMWNNHSTKNANLEILC